MVAELFGEALITVLALLEVFWVPIAIGIGSVVSAGRILAWARRPTRAELRWKRLVIKVQRTRTLQMLFGCSWDHLKASVGRNLLRDLQTQWSRMKR